MTRPFKPTTVTGRWAAGLALASVLLNGAWRVLPLGGAAALAVGVAGGVVALVAIERGRDSSIAVRAALVPLVLALLFVVAELATP